MTKISLLCPTRNRPSGIETTIKSLKNTTKQLSDISLVLCVDPDDLTRDRIEEIIKKEQDMSISLLISPERYGYSHLNKYYDYMISKTPPSEMYILWNDDVEMITHFWDSVFLQTYNQRIYPACVLQMRDVTSGWTNLFPCVTKDWINLFGHMAPGPHLDSCIEFVCKAVPEIEIFLPIEVRHNRPTEDKVLYSESKKIFWGNECQTAIAKDKEKLQTYYNKKII